jgi:hypothetical protein
MFCTIHTVAHHDRLPVILETMSGCDSVVSITCQLLGVIESRFGLETATTESRSVQNLQLECHITRTIDHPNLKVLLVPTHTLPVMNPVGVILFPSPPLIYLYWWSSSVPHVFADRNALAWA